MSGVEDSQCTDNTKI